MRSAGPALVGLGPVRPVVVGPALVGLAPAGPAVVGLIRAGPAVVGLVRVGSAAVRGTALLRYGRGVAIGGADRWTPPSTNTDHYLLHTRRHGVIATNG
ncbi:MAG: hypothetical protein QOC74_3802 [Pseudonocardiales bacterium]|nr:hypothetical protein [Pseudonocardiales bacterium]